MEVGNASRLVAEIEHWRPAFEKGTIHHHALLRPKFDDGERLAATIPQVGTTQQDVGVPMSEWTTRPGSTGLRGRAEGIAFATSGRLLVANGRSVHHEWRWADVSSVSVLANLLGVAVRATPDGRTVDVVASEFFKHIAASDPFMVVTGWLKTEGAFESSRGRLDEWMASLPARLGSKPEG